MPAAEASCVMTCFKAYDIRGRLGVDLDEAIARRIGRAFAETLGASKVVLGRDCRASSLSLAAAVADGMTEAGVEVLDLGLSGTEEMYSAVSHFGADGGVCVTASHNPMDYNGMKLVKRGSAPLDPATEFAAIRALAERAAFAPQRAGGRVVPAEDARNAYVGRVLSFVDVAALRPLKLLVNAGNGAAGPTLDAILAGLAARGAKLDVVRIHHEPDGRFPNGIPNPLLPENRPVTAEAVRACGADLGIAWDGDFDRCFFFDSDGRFIDGEYIVGLLAAAFLAREPGATIVHDPRIVWNTRAIVAAAGGKAVQSRTGHAFIKQALRDHDAVYGGEMSAHHYFRDFVFCDSGMIPWLLVIELMSRRALPLAALVDEAIAAFPSSGEINFTLADPAAAMARVEAVFLPASLAVDRTDGLGLEFADWRFNLRASNTEPVVRLNVEARADRALVEAGVSKVKAVLLASG